MEGLAVQTSGGSSRPDLIGEGLAVQVTEGVAIYISPTSREVEPTLLDRTYLCHTTTTACWFCQHLLWEGGGIRVDKDGSIGTPGHKVGVGVVGCDRGNCRGVSLEGDGEREGKRSLQQWSRNKWVQL